MPLYTTRDGSETSGTKDRSWKQKKPLSMERCPDRQRRVGEVGVWSVSTTLPQRRRKAEAMAHVVPDRTPGVERGGADCGKGRLTRDHGVDTSWELRVRDP